MHAFTLRDCGSDGARRISPWGSWCGVSERGGRVRLRLASTRPRAAPSPENRECPGSLASRQGQDKQFLSRSVTNTVHFAIFQKMRKFATTTKLFDRNDIHFACHDN